MGWFALGILTPLLIPGIIGAFKLQRVVRWRQRPRTTGTVVDTHYVSVGGQGTGSSYEIIEFRTPDGQTVVAEPFHRHSGLRSRVGTEVEVYYDPADPQRIFAPSTIVTEAGLIYLVIGLPLAAFSFFGLTQITGG